MKLEYFFHNFSWFPKVNRLGSVNIRSASITDTSIQKQLFFTSYLDFKQKDEHNVLFSSILVVNCGSYWFTTSFFKKKNDVVCVRYLDEFFSGKSWSQTNISRMSPVKIMKIVPLTQLFTPNPNMKWKSDNSVYKCI